MFSLGLLDPFVLFALNYLFQAINTFFLPASCQSLRGFSKTGISRFSSGDRSESPPPLRGLSSRLDPHICQTKGQNISPGELVSNDHPSPSIRPLEGTKPPSFLSVKAGNFRDRPSHKAGCTAIRRAVVDGTGRLLRRRSQRPTSEHDVSGITRG